jgi:hypothetical protein
VSGSAILVAGGNVLIINKICYIHCSEKLKITKERAVDCGVIGVSIA